MLRELLLHRPEQFSTSAWEIRMKQKMRISLQKLKGLQAPVPMWLFALWALAGSSLIAYGAVPLFTGSVSVPAAGSETQNQLTASSLVATDPSKILTSATSGLSPSFVNVTLSALTATTVACVNGSKAFTSSCSSATPTFSSVTSGPLTLTGTTGTASTVYVSNDAGNNLIFNVPTGNFPASFRVNGSTVATVSNTGFGTFAGLSAGAGTIQGSSDGSHTSYIGPSYTAGGAATSSTWHHLGFAIQIGSGGVTVSTVTGGGCSNSGVVCQKVSAITLSGAAAYAGQYTYGCTGTDEDSTANALGAVNASGSSFQLTAVGYSSVTPIGGTDHIWVSCNGT